MNPRPILPPVPQKLILPPPAFLHTSNCCIKSCEASLFKRLLKPASEKCPLFGFHSLTASYERRPGRSRGVDRFLLADGVKVSQCLDNIVDALLDDSGMDVLDAAIEEYDESVVESLQQVSSRPSRRGLPTRLSYSLTGTSCFSSLIQR